MKKDKGITLIALVITIILLIILAGIGIRMSLGNNGLFNKAKQGKEDYLHAANTEQDEMKNIGESLDGLVTESGTSIDLSKYLKVGDYVDYDPTKTDASKTQNIDENKVTYISPIGGYDEEQGIITHGNGHSSQTFTAKSNDGTSNGLKWRVLNIEGNKLELISENPILTDAGTTFSIKGGIGYLYAEQELNEVCKIYGYGYGADTNIGANYEVGGPFDTTIKGKITGTGARSITINDINKKAGVTKEDLPTINLYYGVKLNPKSGAYYPTLSSNNTIQPGKSATVATEYEWTFYYYDKTRIVDTTIQNMLFNGNYWLASRSIGQGTYMMFNVSGIYGDSLSNHYMCITDSVNLFDGGELCNHYSVRPIVNLKATTIDINSAEEDIGTATNPWKLK